MREPVLPRYERATFEKALISPQGQPLAYFICPGSPLLDSVIDLTPERNRELLKRGTILVDESDPGTDPRMFFYLEHAIQDASLTKSGARRIVSKQVHHIELNAAGDVRHIHYAPYLDYRPLAAYEPGTKELLARPECSWIGQKLERKAQEYAGATIAREHFEEVKRGRLEINAKTEAAVKDRLTKEINYWDHRAEELKAKEKAGKSNSRLVSSEARKRADLLQGRLQKRLEELSLEAQLSPMSPVIQGGFLVVPIGLIRLLQGKDSAFLSTLVRDTQASAARARTVIMDIERSLGFEPVDREFEKVGYDIESRIPGTGRLRLIEVKGRISGATSITVTKNEVLYSLNKPEDYILAIVEFLDETSHKVHYLRQPFRREPDFGVTSVNYDFAELIARAEEPR